MNTLISLFPPFYSAVPRSSACSLTSFKSSWPRPLLPFAQKSECRSGVREWRGGDYFTSPHSHFPLRPLRSNEPEKGGRQPPIYAWPVLSTTLGARSVVLEWCVLPASYVPTPSTAYFPYAHWGWESTKKNLGGRRPPHLCALPPILTTPRLFALLHWPASIPSCVRLVPFLAQLCSFHESAAAAASTSPTSSLVAGTPSPWY